MKKILLVVSVILGVVLFSPSSYASKPLPIETFSKGREYNQVKISPTGKYLAFISKHAGKNVLVFLELNKFTVLHVVNFPDNGQVGDYEWVSEERVVLQKQYVDGWETQPKYYGELFGINADGSRSEYLIGYRGKMKTGSNVREATALRATSYLLDPLVSDEDKALIVSYPWASSDKMLPDNMLTEAVALVYELNVHTGKRRKVAAAPNRKGRFLTDNQGQVKIAVSAQNNDQDSIFVRTADKSDWKELQLSEKLSKVQVHAFDGSGENVYISGSHNGLPQGVYSLNLKSGATKLIFQDKKVDPSQLWVDPVEKSLFAIELELGYPTYAFTRENVSRSAQLKSLLASIPGNQVQIISATTDGSKVIVLAHSDVNPGDYYLFDTQKNELKYLASSRKWVDPNQMSAMEPIAYKSRDGLTIHGYLTVPKGKEKQNLPLVVLPHKGPHGERNVWEFDPQVQLLASRGLAVLQVNYRGSSGYGSEFEEAGYRHWGGAVQHDIIDGVNFLFDKGIADKKRVCIMGASFGGYSALQSAILEPDMFQCAVGVMGMYDLPKMFETGELSESDAGLSYLKKVLGDEPAKLSAISPSYNVDKLKVPVFIVHGGEDKKAPIEQAESLVNALKKNDKDYSYYVLENEGHGFYTAKSRTQYYEQVLAFLSQHLKL